MVKCFKDRCLILDNVRFPIKATAMFLDHSAISSMPTSGGRGFLGFFGTP